MHGPVCLMGGAGFIGSHVLVRLLEKGHPIRALQRVRAVAPAKGLEVIPGSLEDPGALSALLVPGCDVVNLVHPQGPWPKSAIEPVIDACRAARVRRLVHLSTAVVAGRTRSPTVTEDTTCEPAPGYEASKLAVERALQEGAAGSFELVVLRPTAVFGPGGLNLASLSRRLMTWPAPLRYVLSCLNGSRRMHLVPVQTVAAAVVFALEVALPSSSETFIVSEDDDPLNEYRAVEALLATEYGIAPFRAPRVPLDRVLLPALLRLRGRSDADPRRLYSAQKIRRAGFASPTTLAVALVEYAKHAKSLRQGQAHTVGA